MKLICDAKDCDRFATVTVADFVLTEANFEVFVSCNLCDEHHIQWINMDNHN